MLEWRQRGQEGRWETGHAAHRGHIRILIFFQGAMWSHESVDILESVRARVNEHFRFTRDLLGGCLESALGWGRGQEAVWEEATGGTPGPGCGSCHAHS